MESEQAVIAAIIAAPWRYLWQRAPGWPICRGAILWLILIQEEKALSTAPQKFVTSYERPKREDTNKEPRNPGGDVCAPGFLGSRLKNLGTNFCGGVLSYTRGFLAEAGLHPVVVATHRRHFADEVEHHRHDVALLDLAWEHASPRWRRLNARLFSWTLTQFFLAPKRAGWRVIEHWLAEHPHLEPNRPALWQQIRALDRDPAHLDMMYRPKVIPRSRERMAACPELRPLLARLDGVAWLGGVGTNCDAR